jgi:hypothetical protein
VVYNFQGQAPASVAAQIGGGAFSSASLQGGRLTLTIPNGTTNYAVAYVCPQAAGLGDIVTAENVIEASVSDGNSFSTSCNLASGNTGTATGSIDTSALAGVSDVLIRGSQGYGGNLGAATGKFNLNLLSGSNDVALIAVDGSGNVRAVKILRGQSVPGSLNSGNRITFTASDQTTTQSLTVANIPSGFSTPASASVEYTTASGTQFVLAGSVTSQFPVIPAAYVESGDFYSIQANTSDVGTHSRSMGVMQNLTGGGAAALSLPKPWNPTAPTPETLPTFSFDYSGYSGVSAIAQQAELEWIPSTNALYTLTVTATTNYQAGSNAITVPDLSGMSGFLPTAASGSQMYWAASIWGGTAPVFDFMSAPPSSGSIAFVQKSGRYTQP